MWFLIPPVTLSPYTAEANVRGGGREGGSLRQNYMVLYSRYWLGKGYIHGLNTYAVILRQWNRGWGNGWGFALRRRVQHVLHLSRAIACGQRTASNWGRAWKESNQTIIMKERAKMLSTGFKFYSGPQFPWGISYNFCILYISCVCSYVKLVVGWSQQREVEEWVRLHQRRRGFQWLHLWQS